MEFIIFMGVMLLLLGVHEYETYLSRKHTIRRIWELEQELKRYKEEE